MHVYNIIKPFDFSTLYTTIPHKLLNLELKNWFALLLKEERKTMVSLSC